MRQIKFSLYILIIPLLFNLNLHATESSQHSLYLGKTQDFKDRPLYVSVVTLEKAKELFNIMASQEHIPFRYVKDGCYSRAHEMTYLLEDMNVIVGKAIAQGKLGLKAFYNPKKMVYWRYHIAPFILVKINGEEKKYIIDPSVLSDVAPVREWEKLMTAHRGAKLYRTLFTNRYVYSQKYIKKDPVEFLEKNIRHARWFLRQLKKKQEDIENAVEQRR